jgi:hypothetical protein
MKKLNPVFLILISFVFIYSCCDTFCERENYANDLIQKVEKFKEEYNRLPENSFELEIIEDEFSKAYYHKISKSEYEIWYAVGFESMIYNSKTKKWREEG